MYIEHLAIYVQDLNGARDFFVRYFGALPNDGYHNRKTDFRSFFLTFPQGPRLELMHRPDMVDKEKHLAQTGYIHMAFRLGSQEAVDALTEQLRRDGYAVHSGPRVTGDGYYESCVVGFEGNLIELMK